MKYLIIFILNIYLFADVSNIILKIKDIENIKKSFLKIDYNIFANSSSNIFTTNIISKTLNSNLNKNLKIFAIFNNKVNINGKWYKVGDYIDNYKIVKITSTGVYLMKNLKIEYIKLINNYILKVK